MEEEDHGSFKAYEMMRDIIKIIQVDSAMLVYIYLMIYGKTTPTDLRSTLSLSKATAFRHLAELERLNFIKRIVDPSVEDKRYNTFYAVDRLMQELMEYRQITAARNYAVQHDPQMINDWDLMIQQFPSSFNKIALEIFHSVFKFHNKWKMQESLSDKKSVQISFILDGEENKEDIKQVRELLTKILNKSMKKELSSSMLEEGIVNPFFFSIQLLDFSKPESINDD